MDDLLRLLRLEDPNTRVVLLGCGVLGATSGVIGSFAVLRRRALIGDALSHAALPGICAAYFIVGDRSFFAFLLGALVFGVLGVLCIGAVQAWTRVKEDAAIGIVLSSFFGLGLVLSRLIQNTPGGNKAGLDGFLFGKAASMVRSDLYLISGAGVVIMLTVAALYREFGLVCFDRGFAASIGRKVVLLDLLIMLLVCVCVIVALPAVGAVLAAALLIIPAAAARFWTDRLAHVVMLSGAFGLVAAVMGAALSAVLPAPAAALSRGWPTGPLIVLFATAVFVVSMLAAPKRGVIADLVRRAGMKRRITMQHLMRAVYELGERRGDIRSPWSSSDLPANDTHLLRAHQREIRSAVRRGLLKVAPSSFADAGRGTERFMFTDEGFARAAKLVRAHRLWELYLIHHADIAPDHVHRDADELEHVLTPDVVRSLEAELRQGDLIREAAAHFPESPHPTASAGGGA